MYNRIMYKNKDRQKQANKEAKRRERGMTPVGDVVAEAERVSQGMTRVAVVEGMTKGVTESEGVTPDIIDKLTSPFWRPRLEKLCSAFSGSPYAKDVRVGVYGPDLETVSELLSATEGIPVVKGEPALPVNRVESSYDDDYVVVGGMRLRKHVEGA